MRPAVIILLVLVAAAHAGCSRGGDKVYRGYLGPERPMMAVVTLHLGPGVRSVTLRERELDRSEYGTIVLAPGEYTIREADDASIVFRIQKNVIDEGRARSSGKLIIGHTYTLRAGKGDDGDRALWIEDARSGEVFVDTR